MLVTTDSQGQYTLLIHNNKSLNDLYFETEEDSLIASAKESLLQAHHVQTDMLTEEARGNRLDISLLAVHSQDHLMTSMSFMDLAIEVIDVYKKIDQLLGSNGVTESP